MRFLLTEDGWIIPLTDKFGSVVSQVFLLIQRAGTGYIQNLDGHGYLIIAGVGLLSTMVAGHLMRLTAGCGYPATNGDRLGFHGVRVVTSMVGHHCHRASISV